MHPESGIAAVVLAAGASRRFGEDNKLLARVKDRTLIECVLDALTSTGIGPIVVVTGWDRDRIERTLRGRDVQFAHNEHWETGMGSSIGAGIAALDAMARGALIVPGDMALLTPEVVKSLIEAFAAEGGDRIVFAATQAGEQRNPVLWPRRYFAELQQLDPSTGAKALLQRVAASERVAVRLDEGMLGDIDTPTELEAARAAKDTPHS